MQTLILLQAALVFSPAEVPEEAQRVGVAGYCTHVIGRADADAMALRWPKLFAYGGTVVAQDPITGDSADEQRRLGARLMAGISYDLVRLREGSLVASAGALECQRQIAWAVLGPFLDSGARLGEREASRALFEAYRAATEQVETELAEERMRLERFESTLDRVLRLEAWRNRFRDGRDRAQIVLDRAAETPAGLNRATIESALSAFVAAEQGLEAIRTSVRRTQAWQVELRGGYDKWFGREQAVPLFGGVTVGFSPGAYLAPGASAAAVDGIAAWRKGDVDALSSRAERALAALGRERTLANRRLEDGQQRLVELDGRLERLGAAPSRETEHLAIETRFERRMIEIELTELRAQLAVWSSFFDR